MKRNKLPSLKTIKELLRYDPITGAFAWLVDRRGAMAGDRAGTKNPSGYLEISIKGTKYRAHRLAWLFMTGQQPPECLDHINGIKDDNRWSNLREATVSQNVINSKVSTRNKVGLKGVSLVPSQNDIWCARIRHEGKLIYLGCFSTPELAHAAYCEAACRLHGEFANSGVR